MKKFTDDLTKLLAEMFDSIDKPKYEYDEDGFPCAITFIADKNDYGILYEDDLYIEHSASVMGKREFVPVLSFVRKGEKCSDGGYLMFDIKKMKVDELLVDYYDNPLSVITDTKLLSMLKSRKVDDVTKNKIMDELVSRGVDYDDPFDEDYGDCDDDKMDVMARSNAGKMF